MAFLVLGYPEITENDFEWIQEIRKTNDELYYNVVKPHFTIVFPTIKFTKESFIQEIYNKIKIKSEAINFELKCAVINRDDFINTWHVFLVPDKGFSDIVKIHDILYSDLLRDELRLEIDFIPHIGIANSKDVNKCKILTDDLNSGNFNIAGKLEELSIVNYENGKVDLLEKIKLK